MPLETHYYIGLIEAGCDEAGRGCLAGDVVAAAVILPSDYDNGALDDSKRLTAHQRETLAEVIKRDAIAWAVGRATPQEIDKMNILRASILAMHRALDALAVTPQAIIVDGNRFTPYRNIPHTTIIKGDGKYQSIAAASIIAKTTRDSDMLRLHSVFPQYHWDKNKGYPTADHRRAIATYGPTPHHRRSFTLLPQPSLFDNL